jgi:hypothetical protein
MAIDLDQAIAQQAGELEALQMAVVAMLKAKPALAAVKIVHEDDGDIENKIEAAFSSTGLLLIVLSPEGRSESPDAASLHLDRLEIKVRIIEVPLINRGAGGSRIPINQAVQHVATWLRNKIIAGNALTFDRFEQDPRADVPTKDVVFRTALTLSDI